MPPEIEAPEAIETPEVETTEAIEPEGIETPEDGEFQEAPEAAPEPAPEAAPAPTYTQEQFGQAVQQAVQERGRQLQQHYEGQTADLRRQIEEAKQAQASPDPALPGAVEWAQADGDPKMHAYLEHLKTAPMKAIEELRAQIAQGDNKRRTEGIQRDIQTRFETETAVAIEKHPVFKDPGLRAYLENAIWAQSMAAVQKGMDPRRFDVGAVAKHLADTIAKLGKSATDAQLQKLSEPGAPSAPKGSPTKPAKVKKERTTEQTIEEGIDNLTADYRRRESA